MKPIDVATLAVLGFVGFRLVTAARYATVGAGRLRALAIARGIRWRHLWPVPFVLTVVITVALLLVQLPILSFGWWTAIGGQGNPVTGTSDRTTGTFLEWLLPLSFVTLLLPAIPLFAYREEEIFRLGCETWSWRRRVLKALQFGLVHALIGIPIGVALALSIGGAWFQRCYLQGYRAGGRQQDGLLESARAHTAYNTVIVLMVMVSMIAIALTGW